MEHFYNDLLETDENITFLLDKNGITNYKGFLLKFKDRYGQSPKAVRRKTGRYNCALFFTSIS